MGVEPLPVVDKLWSGVGMRLLGQLSVVVELPPMDWLIVVVPVELQPGERLFVVGLPAA